VPVSNATTDIMKGEERTSASLERISAQ
jgi:hypothetical protein